MTKEQEATLSLIRTAITGKVYPLPSSVDWGKVIDFASTQGVLGICFEAIEKTLSGSTGSPQAKSPTKGESIGLSMDDLMDWLGQVEYQKTEFEHKVEVATAFASALSKEGLRISVLKGLSYARYYQHPEYRYSCDFDCYLTDFEKGNEIAVRLGASVDSSEQKHSHIQLKGVHIENHRECTGIRQKGLEEHLTSKLFLAGCDRYNDTALELPPLSFDALFCLYHAQTHFVVEDGIQLRHVIDWVLLRRSLSKAGLYDACVAESRQYGLYKFMQALNGIADLLEGKKQQADLSEAERLLLKDILKPSCIEDTGKGWLAVRLHLFKQIRRNSWKYKLFTDTSSTKEIGKYITRFLKRLIGR